MSKRVKEFTAQNWEREVLGADKPVLVDIWAPWCGPCRMQGPMVDQVAEEIGEGAVVGKLNSDEHPEVAAHYRVRGIPTLLLFKDGEVRESFVGVTPPERLTAALLAQAQ